MLSEQAQVATTINRDSLILAAVLTVQQDWGRQTTSPSAVWRGQFPKLAATALMYNETRIGTPGAWNDVRNLYCGRGQEARIDQMIQRWQTSGLAQVHLDPYHCPPLDYIRLTEAGTVAVAKLGKQIRPAKIEAYTDRRQREIWADWLADQEFSTVKVRWLKFWRRLTAPRPQPAPPDPLPEPFQVYTP